MKKIELHIKWVTQGYSVSYKDGKIWRSFTPTNLTREQALKEAYALIKRDSRKFLRTVCNCGTPIFDNARM